MGSFGRFLGGGVYRPPFFCSVNAHPSLQPPRALGAVVPGGMKTVPLFVLAHALALGLLGASRLFGPSYPGQCEPILKT